MKFKTVTFAVGDKSKAAHFSGEKGTITSVGVGLSEFHLTYGSKTDHNVKTIVSLATAQITEHLAQNNVNLVVECLMEDNSKNNATGHSIVTVIAV